MVEIRETKDILFQEEFPQGQIQRMRFLICSYMLKKEAEFYNIVFKNVNCGGPLISAQIKNKLFDNIHCHTSDKFP